MRIPEAGPFGETFFDARLFAIVAALLVNKPGGGCVESVVTFATHLLPLVDFLFSADFFMRTPIETYAT